MGDAASLARRVLVVEDNELNLKLFCDLLRAHGYDPTPVRDGRDAVECAQRIVPDLIITDIQLPHVTGLELIQKFRSDPLLGDVPIMAVTAYAGPDDEDRIRSAGANAYVSKPISVMRFITEVKSLLPDAADETPRQNGPALQRHGFEQRGQIESQPLRQRAPYA